MKRSTKAFTLGVIAGAMLLSAPIPGLAEGNMDYQEPSWFQKTTDLLIARPILLGVTAITSTVYVVTSPVTYTLGDSQQAYGALVKHPADQTFVRCLGCPTHK